MKKKYRMDVVSMTCNNASMTFNETCTENVTMTFEEAKKELRRRVKESKPKGEIQGNFGYLTEGHNASVRIHPCFEFFD